MQCFLSLALLALSSSAPATDTADKRLSVDSHLSVSVGRLLRLYSSAPVSSGDNVVELALNLRYDSGFILIGGLRHLHGAWIAGSGFEGFMGAGVAARLGIWQPTAAIEFGVSDLGAPPLRETEAPPSGAFEKIQVDGAQAYMASVAAPLRFVFSFGLLEVLRLRLGRQIVGRTRTTRIEITWLRLGLQL